MFHPVHPPTFYNFLLSFYVHERLHTYTYPRSTRKNPTPKIPHIASVLSDTQPIRSSSLRTSPGQGRQCFVFLLCGAILRAHWTGIPGHDPLLGWELSNALEPTTPSIPWRWDQFLHQKWIRDTAIHCPAFFGLYGSWHQSLGFGWFKSWPRLPSCVSDIS